MKKRANLEIAGLVLMCLLLFCPSVFSEESASEPSDGSSAESNTLFGYCKKTFQSLDLQAYGSLDFYSKYIWRGFTLDKDPVLQPSFSLAGYGLTFTVWGNMDADNSDNINSDEVDLIVDYTKSFGNLSFSAGHTYYDFIGAGTYSREFYVGAGLGEIPMLPIPISAKLLYYFDYGKKESGGGDGQYLALTLAHSRQILKDPKIGLDLAATFGYNSKLFINGTGEQVTFTTGFSIPLTETLTFKPNVNYAIPMGDLAAASDGNQSSRFYSGFSMSYIF